MSFSPFDFEDYEKYINGVIRGGVPVLYRNRLQCKLEKSKNFNDENYSSQIALGLNEVIINRGHNSFLSNLDLYVNDYLITTVQGDGLIVSTTTGSTAYAMAAGASMSHPSVQSIIIAPICPHSLSFRPIVLPVGVDIKIELSPDSRCSAFYSVDGRNTTELKQGFYLLINTSEYSLPTISRSDQIGDWFEGLANCLHWNHRPKQLPLNSGFMRSRSGSGYVSPFLSKSASTSSFLFNNNNNYDVNNLNVPSIDYGNVSEKEVKKNAHFELAIDC